jgi:hypothetical protein
MGRKNLVQELDVYLNEKHVGTLIKQLIRTSVSMLFGVASP